MLLAHIECVKSRGSGVGSGPNEERNCCGCGDVPTGRGGLTGSPLAWGGAPPTSASGGLTADGGTVTGDALAALKGLARQSAGIAVSGTSGMVRCAPVDRVYYCLHVGWVNELPVMDQQQPQVNSLTGDALAVSSIAALASLSPAKRLAQEAAEVADAVAAVGKVLFYEYLADGSIPASTLDAFPGVRLQAQTAGLGSPDVACPVSQLPTGLQIAGVGVAACPPALPLMGTSGNSNRGLKQPNSYYCGPTAMAILAWNDPVKGNTAHYNEPSFWAPKLGTTTNGTSITAIVPQINQNLTGWTGRVGAFAVVSIATWNEARWKSLFQNHIGANLTPILLHPWLPSMSYWPSGSSAGGHFNVGRSYNFTSTSSVNWTIGIYEPAGKSLGINSVMTATFKSVKKANEDNTGFKNIGY